MLKSLILVVAVGGVLFAIAAALVGLVLKSVVLGRFRLDAAWYAHNARAVRNELRSLPLTARQRFLRHGLLASMYGASVGIVLGVVGFALLLLA